MTAFELQRGKPLDRDILVSVVTIYSPVKISEMLSSHSRRIDGDFAKMEHILGSSLSTDRIDNAAGMAIRPNISQQHQ